MLVGHPPYKRHGDKGGKKLLEDVKNGQFSFPEASWSKVSESGKDLVQKLMNINPSKRFNGPQTLKHKWMRHKPSSSTNKMNGMRSHSQPNGLNELKELNEGGKWSGKKRRHQIMSDDDCKHNGNGYRHRVPPRKR